ncbi:MAG: hypothetical protein C0404_14840 [Verrucomicrobia bacterium]|nr:hypothetical protein [Verrucomicrobiota bacterium]
MKRTNKQMDPLPKSFASYDDAGDFWDSHDLTNYLDQLEKVKADIQLKGRRFEIEVDADVASRLLKRAKKERVPVNTLASRMLRRDLAVAHA